MRWASKFDAQKAHIENYRSDNVKKGYGSPYQPHFHRVEFIVENVKKDALVLDVGCNAGALDIPLMQKGCFVKGIDLVKDLVEKAKKQGVRAEVGEAEDLSRFKDNQFDVVICTEVLEHLFEPHIAIEEAYRVLKKGGHYLATVPYFGGKMANENFLGDYHQQNFTYEMLDTIFHSIFDRGKVMHVEIPYPAIYCKANNLEQSPQWVGIKAQK